MASVLPPFSLADMAGEDRAFPTGAPALVFRQGGLSHLQPGHAAAAGGPRCRRRAGSGGGTDDGGQPYVDRPACAFAAASGRLDVEGVVRLRRRNRAACARCERGGEEIDRLVGFDRAEWRAFFENHLPTADVDWDTLPSGGPAAVR